MFAASLVTAVLAIPLSAGAVLVVGAQRVERTAVEGVAELPGNRGDDVLNVLVVGSDSREGLSAADAARYASPQDAGQRADTIMLVQVRRDGERVALVSIPRDLRVERCDGSVGKINAAYAVGERIGRGDAGDGPGCLVRTVAELTGAPVHHYVEVTFSAFVDVVDAIGGVRMWLDEPIRDRDAHVDLPAGCVVLDGRDALGFVRVRKIDDDFGRIARQQRFAAELLDELTAVGTLANPVAMAEVVDRTARAVRTDDGLGLGALRSLAMGLRRLSWGDVTTATVPGDLTTIDGSSYVVLRRSEAAELFARIRTGALVAGGQDPGPAQAAAGAAGGVAAAPAAAVAPTGQPAPSPAAAGTVVVRRGQGNDELAPAVARLLERGGFAVALGPAAWRSAETEVRHPPALHAAAAQVAMRLPRGHLVADAGADRITVVLGRDLSADLVLAVTPAGAPAAPPPAAYTGAARPQEGAAAAC